MFWNCWKLRCGSNRSGAGLAKPTAFFSVLIRLGCCILVILGECHPNQGQSS